MAAEKVTEIPKLLKDATQRQYLPDGQLGSGGFATCFRASMVDRRVQPESPYCALKAVKANVPKNLIQRFRLELAIQSKLRHPQIVELYRAFTFQDVTYVALELCPNGSLTDMMKRRKYLTMGEIRRMLIQLCGAVKYLHDRDIVHRDIKAGNIFLDENMNVKLGDFGLAAMMEPSPKSTGADASTLQHIRRTTFCGTPNYLAPEILSRGEGHGTSVDIWAIGVLAYYLAVGRAPFHSKSKDEIYARLRKGEYSWPELAPEQNEIPEDLRDLVGMLLVEESRRPSPDEIVAHRFFSEGFIPQKLDALCRTRRPRFARVGEEAEGQALGRSPPSLLSKHTGEQRSAYNQLCISSRVGDPWKAKQETMKEQKPEPSMFLVLAKEVSQKVKLEIPLREGLVYTGRPQISTSTSTLSRKRAETVRPTKAKGAPTVQILEDAPQVEAERKAAEEIKASYQASAQQQPLPQKAQRPMQEQRQQAPLPPLPTFAQPTKTSATTSETSSPPPVEEPQAQEQFKKPPRRTRAATKAQTISTNPVDVKSRAQPLRSTMGTGNGVRARVAEFEGRGKLIEL